ncbi:translin-associated protein X [Biomphalaria glabrata]|nr:translin-associated protein X-like [Biomphalaria glabrata]
MDSSGTGASRSRFKKSHNDNPSIRSIINDHDGNRGREDRNSNTSSSNRKRLKVNDSSLSKDSPIFKAFNIFREELDNRNNRYERIVKISRDITIESKRIIFLLQRVTGSEESEKVFAEAKDKILDLNRTKFLELAHELHGQDPYQFVRAYSPGLQEYIEAVTFYHYLHSEELIGLERIQADLIYLVKAQDAPGLSSDLELTLGTNSSECLSVKTLAIESNTNAESSEKDTTDQNSTTNENGVSETTAILVPVPPSEYLLGIGDFTGELMRMAINSVGAGDLEKPSVVSNMMRLIHDAFTTFAHPPRELYQKIRVLRQSLQKVETACYTLKVRGSEIPKHMLADVFSISAPCAADSYNEEISDVYD